jgi:uncharacterized protein YndB with AHSA1/START domain
MESTDIVIDVPLRVPVERAWKAWIHSVELQKWLAAKATVNPVIGGAYELFWEPENPDRNSTIGCRVAALVPERLIAFTWKGPVPFVDLMNVEPLPTWGLVAFERAPGDSSIMHFRHSGWGTTERWRQAKQWQENAWRGAFSGLQAYLSTM